TRAQSAATTLSGVMLRVVFAATPGMLRLPAQNPQYEATPVVPNVPTSVMIVVAAWLSSVFRIATRLFATACAPSADQIPDMVVFVWPGANTCPGPRVAGSAASAVCQSVIVADA